MREAVIYIQNGKYLARRQKQKREGEGEGGKKHSGAMVIWKVVVGLVEFFFKLEIGSRKEEGFLKDVMLRQQGSS